MKGIEILSPILPLSSISWIRNLRPQIKYASHKKGFEKRIEGVECCVFSEFLLDITQGWLNFLTSHMPLAYKYNMGQANEIKTSLKREYDLYSNAVAFYKRALQKFEERYQISTQTFLKRFEAGHMGDDADYFDWYAFAKLLARWRKMQSAIRSAIQ